MADQPSLRISDADRERATAVLRDAYAEGRLSAQEFHERTDRALVARTAADLAPLTADLPAPAPAPMGPDPARRRELRKIWTAWASMAILLTAVWVLTAVTSDDVPGFWPVWPLGITGALAVVRTLNLRHEDGDAAARETASGQDLRGRRDQPPT